MSSKNKNQKQQQPKKAAQLQSSKIAAKPAVVARPTAQQQSVPQAARSIEKQIVKAEGDGIGVVEHGVPHRTGFRHGYLERTAVRIHKNGMTQCYTGVERLGSLRANPNTQPGEVLDKVQLSAKAFGRVLPRYASPFSKQLFTKVKLRFVPEPALIVPTTQGSVYMGINFDPSAPVPIGDVGVDDVATWAPNDEMKALRDSGDMWVHARLDLRSQVPLFIDNDDGTKELQLISQGQMVFLSGSALNEGATESIALGEWFVYFDVEFYQLNTSPGDVENGVMIGHVNEAATPIYDLSKFTQWMGDTQLVLSHDQSLTGVTFSVPAPGTYVVELHETAAPGNGANTSGSLLAFYQSGGISDPVPIKNCSLASTVVSVNTFTPSMRLESLNGLAATQAVWHKNDGSQATQSSTGNSAVSSRWAFSAPQGAVFVLKTSTFNATAMCDIVIMKIDGTFHSDGVLPTRTTANATLSLASVRQFEKIERALAAVDSLSPTDMKTLLLFINNNREKLDAAMLNVVIEKCELPIPKQPTTTMVLPALAAVATWAIATFGPILAEKACRWIERKLDGK